jgi:hypothetical protein
MGPKPGLVRAGLTSGMKEHVRNYELKKLKITCTLLQVTHA